MYNSILLYTVCVQLVVDKVTTAYNNVIHLRILDVQLFGIVTLNSI